MDNKVNKNNGWRMYFFVLYNISGRQQGIQAGHAALEYARTFGDTPEYQDFIKNHKTWIVLSGGGSNDILQREIELEEHGIKFESFQEPDLNDSVSAIAFLVPEEIYGLSDQDIEDANYAYRVELGDEEARKNYSNAITATYLRGFRLASN